jgi:hypothetical protein
VNWTRERSNTNNDSIIRLRDALVPTTVLSEIRGEFSTAQVSPSGELLVCGGVDKHFSVYSIAKNVLLFRVPCSHDIQTVSFNSAGNQAYYFCQAVGVGGWCIDLLWHRLGWFLAPLETANWYSDQHNPPIEIDCEEAPLLLDSAPSIHSASPSQMCCRFLAAPKCFELAAYCIGFM